MKIRVLVIFGGRSGEHEVSLMSARSIIDNLDSAKYEIYSLGITHAGVWLTGEAVLDAFVNQRYTALKQAVLLPNPGHAGLFIIENSPSQEVLKTVSSIDVVFPVIHGTNGEDGILQGYLEMCGIPYVGAGVLGSAVGMDKGVFKNVMQANGIPVLENIVIMRADLKDNMNAVIDQAEKVSPYPLFVKPANMGSSVGVSKCHNRSDLLEGLHEAARFDTRILVERGIEAREIEVSILGNQETTASVPGEVVPSREFYSYEAKYVDEASRLIIPAPLEPAQAQLIQSLALRAYQAVDAKGMARVDFLMDKHTGEIYLSEINTIPGFTKISMYPKLWQASGLPYTALLDRLIGLALERKQERDQLEWKYSA